MNKFLVLIILMSFSGFAQQLTYRTGGNVLNSNSEKLQPDAVRELMKKNESALASYNSGRNKKTWGNVLFYGGLGFATINLASVVFTDTIEVDAYGNITTKKTSPVLGIIGGAMVLVSIPIKTGYTSKIKTAIDNYNQHLASTENWNPNISIVADNDGIGLKISF